MIDLLFDEVDDALRARGPSRETRAEEARIRVRAALARGVVTSNEARALLAQLGALGDAAA